MRNGHVWWTSADPQTKAKVSQAINQYAAIYGYLVAINKQDPGSVEGTMTDFKAKEAIDVLVATMAGEDEAAAEEVAGSAGTAGGAAKKQKRQIKIFEWACALTKQRVEERVPAMSTAAT